MTPELWQKVCEALNVLEPLTPDQRAHELQRLRSSDPLVANEAESLLRQRETPERTDLEKIATEVWRGLDDGGRPGAASASAPPKLPAQIGPYQVLEQIGEGGMGVVYRVRDPRFHRSLAVKVLKEKYRDNADLKRRFLEEAQLMGQLQHPGIPPIHDLGELPDGRTYFTMKLIRAKNQNEQASAGDSRTERKQGRTLAHLLKERSDARQNLPLLLSIFEQVCQTLAYAHNKKIIHRDLKPANIMLGAFGEVQVMDWGLAKVLVPAPSKPVADEEPQASVICTVRTTNADSETQAGLAMGTPAYMAPEQARGEVAQLDERCDVFGLGAILCEILTQRPPFTGSAVLEQAQQGMTGAALALLQQCGVEQTLLQMVQHCLAFKKEDRPADAGQVAQVIGQYQAAVQDRLKQAEIQRAQAEVKAAEERKRRRQVLVMAVLLLGLMGIAAFAYVRGERHRSELQAQSQIGFDKWRSQAISLHGLARAAWDRVRVVPFPDPLQRQEAKRQWQELAKVIEAGEVWRNHEETAVQNHAGELALSLEEETKTALTDLRMLDLLEEGREQRANITDKDLDLVNLDNVIVFGHAAIQAYAVAFQHYRIDAAKDDPEVASRRISQSNIKVPLATALDDWLALETDRASASRLYEIARRADPDPLRNQLRSAVITRNVEQLKQLAKNAMTAKDLPVPTTIFLADGLHQAGELALAVQVLEQTQQEHPGDFWTNDILGVFLLNADPSRAADAIRYFSMAVALRPAKCYFVYDNLGICHLLRNQLEAAEQSYQKALKQRPGYLNVKINLSHIRSRQGKIEDAILLCREVLKEQPDHFSAQCTLAQHLMAKGQVQDAEEVLQRVLRHKPEHPTPQLHLAMILAEKNELDLAIDKVTHLAKKHPRRVEILQALGGLWTKKNVIDKALEVYAQALKLQPLNGFLYFDLCYCHLLQSDYVRAARAARNALRLRPEYGHYFVNLSVLFLRENKTDQAIFALEWSIQADPAFTEGHFALANAYANKGQDDPAGKHFAIAIDLNPKKIEAYVQLARLCKKRREFDLAIGYLQQALKIDENYAPAYFELSWAYSRKGAFDKDIEALKKVLKLNPIFPYAHANLAWSYNQIGAYDQAIEPYEEALKTAPNDDAARANLVFAYIEQGQLLKARSTLQREAKSTTSPVPPSKLLTTMRTTLEALLKLEPHLPAIVKGSFKPKDYFEALRCGRLCRVHQYYGAALRCYEEALAADPKAAKETSVWDLLAFARASLLAAAGKGNDAPPEMDQPALRSKALGWLRQYLKAHQEKLQKNHSEYRYPFQENIRLLLLHQDFVSVRPPALKVMPAAERGPWQTFWHDVEHSLRQADVPALKVETVQVLNEASALAGLARNLKAADSKGRP